MSELPSEGPLPDRRYVTVVLRFVLDRGGRIDHGEIVDVDGTVHSRFSGWHGLVRALRTWLGNGQ